MDKLIGTVLGDRYQIAEVAGTGGMSKVYKALDLLENRYVAVKILREEFVNEQKSRKRFVNESRAIALLSHQNVVDVYDVNFEGNTQYIVMEYVDGKTLKEYMEECGQMQIKEALAYCGQILSGLRHAHERGVIHRDVKPQNIILLENGILKVADFGIAHVSNFETVTMTDMAIGSVHYISPEQARGNAVDERSDIYSTGIILYEMITGKLPFESDTAVSVALKQVQEIPAKPSELRPDIPIGVEQIIIKAMQKDVDNRYQNARDMQKDILRFFDDENIVFDYPENIMLSNSDTMEVPVIHEEISPLEDEKKEEKPDKKLKRVLNGDVSEKTLKKNRIIAAASGALSALILVVIGSVVMFMMVNKLSSRLVDIPDMVGRAITDVQSDTEIIDNFELKVDYGYDDIIAAGIVISQEPEEGKFNSGKEISVIVSQGQRSVNVPAITGLDAAQAAVVLKENDLIAEKVVIQSTKVEAGKVESCDPGVNTSVPVGSTVKIYVAAGSSTTMVKVPYVTGKDLQSALSELYQKGLKVKVQETYSSDIKADTVISQSIEGQTDVEADTEITITVSKGTAPAEDPGDSNTEE